ncbi:MAG: hypothetical protein MK290_00400 [Pedosphaera sp.]|jgi:hypothetical protein|nr:hypothetical protein [Pedosphaera sp.]
MIGLVVILPLAFFTGWILKNSVTLYRGRAWPSGWVGLFWLSAALGLTLGVWFCGYAEWESMQFRRLPIPIARFNPATDVWRELEMSSVMRYMVLTLDFFAGLALAMFPITASMRFAEFMDESRRLAAARADQSSPSADDAP